MRTKYRLVKHLMTAAILAGSLYPYVLAAQSNSTAPKAAFDIRRFSPTPAGTFETFYVTAPQPLKQALDAGTLKEDTRVLVTETAAGKLALLTDQMAFHHLAEGNVGGKDWMVSF